MPPASSQLGQTSTFPCSFPPAASTCHLVEETVVLSSLKQSPMGVLLYLLSGWLWSCSLPLFLQAVHPSNCPSTFLILPCCHAAGLWAGSECLWAGNIALSLWVERWEEGSSALLQLRQAAGPANTNLGQLLLTWLVLQHFHISQSLFWFCQRLHLCTLLTWEFHSLCIVGM